MNSLIQAVNNLHHAHVYLQRAMFAYTAHEGIVWPITTGVKDDMYVFIRPDGNLVVGLQSSTQREVQDTTLVLGEDQLHEILERFLPRPEYRFINEVLGLGKNDD